MRDKACFIPTLSGLGYTQAADNCQAVGADLVCTATTPFDAYYGPTGHNEEHIQLTPANVEFIRNEILKITPTPVFEMAPLSLCPDTGPTPYTVHAECVAASRGSYTPPGTTYAWTVGPGLVLVSGQGAASVQIRPVSGFTGISTVQVVATRTGYTASAPVSVEVNVTRGELNLDYYSGARVAAGSAKQNATDEVVIESAQGPGTDTTCPSQLVQLQLTSFNVAAPPYTVVRTVYRNQQPTSTSSYALNSNRFSVSVGVTNFEIKVTGTSICDGQPVTSNALFFEAITCGQRVAAYPNPADATLHLVLTGEATGAASVTSTLYNSQGRAVRRVVAATELDTSTLPTGLYYLVTEQHGQAERHQIRVQH